MAIKIGKWYITRNNPREILNISREKQDRIDSAIEYIKYNDSDLYTFEPDYDYEENLVDNYEPSSFKEDLLNILQNGGDKDEK